MRSMTCYGAGAAEIDGLTIEVEIRAVNHRYLDTQLRLPRDYMALEAKINQALKARFGRGRVEVFVRRGEGGDAQVHINEDMAKAYSNQLRALGKGLGIQGDVTLATIIGLPGVVSTTEVSRQADADWPNIERALTQAVEAAHAMSVEEGAALARDIQERLDKVTELTAYIERLSQGQVDAYRARLQEKLSDVFSRHDAGEIDQGRLLQEVVILADKADVTEEIIRMGSHLDQCKSLMGEEGLVGRKLDFLLQELFRETNTIASKTPVPEVKSAAVDIKVELERIREQIQNIE